MMADNKEQKMRMKFCFLLGKSATETVLMLLEAFKEEALSKTQVYKWYSCFKGVKCHVRTSQDLAKLQPAEMMKILKEFATQSMQIVVRPLMRFLR